MSQEKDIRLTLSTSPFVKRKEDTPYIMRHVILSLVPAMLAAVYFFGLSAILLIITCIAGAALSEHLLSRDKDSLKDHTALLTGVLLAMTLPPGFPLWMAFLGAVFAIVFGKIIFGGLGANIFNPALVGRAFLQASFPVAITTWAEPGGRFMSLKGDLFATPFLKPVFDGLSTATPLSLMKFESKLTPLTALIQGNVAGSLGETCAVALLIGGLYLAYRNFLNWRIPAGVFIAAFASGAALHYYSPGAYPPPIFHIFSGGLILGAVYMATDPVSSPVTQKGCWLFGAGIGILVVVIRVFGGLPEGVMYSILFMNALSPLIGRVSKARVYGTETKGWRP